MYIQITTRCNMYCAHCCFDCTSVGVDMPRKVFIKACKLAADYDDTIQIGGGEPTVNPLFWDFIGISLKYQTEGIWLATNGLKTTDALALARFNSSQQGPIWVELSQDNYHKPIDLKVVSAFGKNFTRTIGKGRLLNTGRAKKNGIGQREECCCNIIFIDPRGNIWQCGCQKDKLGTVYKPRYNLIDKVRSRESYCKYYDS